MSNGRPVVKRRLAPDAPGAPGTPNRAAPKPGHLPDTLGDLSQIFGRQTLSNDADLIPPGPPRAPSVIPPDRGLIFFNNGFIVGATAQKILNGNAARGYLLIQNNSGGTMWVGFDSAPSQFTGLLLPGGSVYEALYVPVSVIYILGSAAGLAGMVVEGFRK